jgi:hypothetical protein
MKSVLGFLGVILAYFSLYVLQLILITSGFSRKLLNLELMADTRRSLPNPNAPAA